MDKVIEDEASERELACTSVYVSKVAVTHWHTGHPEGFALECLSSYLYC